MEAIRFETFCADPNLLDMPVSAGWVAAFKALDGKPLAEDERRLLAQMGVEGYDGEERRELWAVKGRRAQGTTAACEYLAYKIATQGHEYRKRATRDERIHIPIVAQTRSVAAEIKARLDGFYRNSPLLSREVEDLSRSQIVLRGGFVISVWTCSYRAPRGVAVPLCLFDEIGVWRQEGANVDREVVRSLTPAMVQFPNARLIALGTPWAKAGALYEAWQRRRERPDRLVVRAATPLMNRLLPKEQLEREQQTDPDNYRREFLAEWVDADVAFLPAEDVDAAVVAGRRELAPADGISYVGAIDASGGGADLFTLAVAHLEGESVIFDALRGWRRKPLDLVLSEIKQLGQAYRLRRFIGDQFAHQALAQLFRDRRISELKKFDITANSKRELFTGFKIALSQSRVELLDHAESLRQLRGLEARRVSGGGVKIGAPAGLHDDFPSSMILAAHQLLVRPGTASVFFVPAGRNESGWTQLN